MSTLQHAWLGNYEVSSTHCTGLTFARHSHDECVIGVNLVGEEKVWLDRREFEAGPGSITLYNPGQIQGGGAADGAPWHFVSLYATADQLAMDLGLAQLEFDRSLCFQPQLARRLAAAVKGALSDDAWVCELNEQALVLLLGDVVSVSGVRLAGSPKTGKSLINRAQELLASQLHQSLPLEQLGDELGLSKFHLLRAFQKETGLAPGSGPCNCARAVPRACCATVPRPAPSPMSWALPTRATSTDTFAPPTASPQAAIKAY